MTLDEFWDHIRATSCDDADAQTERLTARLAVLPVTDIIDFDHHWRTLRNRAYRRDLWHAAYLINGGCSDDGFFYFRDWLILQGRDVYEAALADPDGLSLVTDPSRDDYEYECWPAGSAFFEATGIDRDDAGYDRYDSAYQQRYPGKVVRQGLIENWDVDDRAEVRRRWPRLASRYMDDE